MNDSTEDGAEPCGVIESKCNPENANGPPDERVDPEPPFGSGTDDPVVWSPNEVDEEVCDTGHEGSDAVEHDDLAVSGVLHDLVDPVLFSLSKATGTWNNSAFSERCFFS